MISVIRSTSSTCSTVQFNPLGLPSRVPLQFLIRPPLSYSIDLDKMSSRPGRQTRSQQAAHHNNDAALESVVSSPGVDLNIEFDASPSPQGGGTSPPTIEELQEAIKRLTQSVAALTEEVRPTAPPASAPSAPLPSEPTAPQYRHPSPTASSSASFHPWDAAGPWGQQDIKLKGPDNLRQADDYKVRGDWMDSILRVFRGAKRTYATDEMKVLYACHCMEPKLFQEFTSFAKKMPTEDGGDPQYSWRVFTRWFDQVGNKAVTNVQAIEEYLFMRQAPDETPVTFAGRLSAIEYKIELSHELFTANCFRSFLLPWVKTQLSYVAGNATLSRQELVEAAQIIWENKNLGGPKRKASPGPSNPHPQKAQKVEREGGPSVQSLGKRRPRGHRGRGRSEPQKCFACNEEGHFADACPNRIKGAAQVHRTTTDSASRKGKARAA